MQAIRRRDTSPELAIRSALHSAGYRYRVDFRIDLNGARVRPDIVFTRRRISVFIDGCFWHCCPDHGRQPSTNEAYWTPKLRGNAERDLRNTAALTHAGWTVIRIWEHESIEDAVSRIVAAVGATALSVRPRASDEVDLREGRVSEVPDTLDR